MTIVSAQSGNAATFVVTKVADTNDGVCDSDCSLREAINAANNSSEDDIIEFDPTVFGSAQTIVLSGTEMIITNNGTLTINGPGHEPLTLDGNLTSRIFSVSPGATLSVSGIRFIRGNGVGATNNNTGGAIMNNAGFVTLTNSVVTENQTSGVSGGIRNSGTGSTLTIVDSIISNNTAGSSGGGVQSFNNSTVTIINSTISGNTSNSGLGGGLMAAGAAHIINSTFSGNTSNGTGGGGISSSGSLLILTNSTIVGNTSVNNGGGLHRGTTNVNGFIRNSIIAGNTGPSPDVSNSAGGIDSQGNNIIGDVGTSTGWIETDLVGVDPLLSPIGNYGGHGLTYLPMSGSPAIDGGQNCVVDQTCSENNPVTPVNSDQRGAERPSGSSVDIGAVEINPVFQVTLRNASVGSVYFASVSTHDQEFSYSVPAGTMPPGLNLISLKTHLSINDFGTIVTMIGGTPTLPGEYTFTMRISHGSNTAFVPYKITILDNAANVSVGGRVLTSSGGGLWNALVKLEDGKGNVRYAATSTFGYYRFDGVATGGPYTVSVENRMYGYSPQTVTVSGEISDLDFTPNK